MFGTVPMFVLRQQLKLPCVVLHHQGRFCGTGLWPACQALRYMKRMLPRTVILRQIVTMLVACQWRVHIAAHDFGEVKRLNVVLKAV